MQKFNVVGSLLRGQLIFISLSKKFEFTAKNVFKLGFHRF